MTDDERIKILEATLARLLQWIAAAESRISLVLGLNTAMLGALAVGTTLPGALTPWAALAGALTVLLLGLGYFNLAQATFPRTDGPDGSMIFFGGIAARHRDVFVEDAKLLDKTRYIADLAAQCHRNAVIANGKFSFVKRAQIWLFASVLPWSGTLFLLYEGRV